MFAIFTRTPNGDGNMQWRCRSVMEGRIKHTEAFTEMLPHLVVTCNVKRAPSTGKFCKRPSYYM
jgi:hypothetical protein